MQEVKYFYNGIPLTKYCLEHGLNPDTIRTRIWKKRKNPKYALLSDQEIIDMSVEVSGTGTKYMYDGISLRQYCIREGLILGTIISRINSLKKENKSLSNDELVRKALNEFENHNYTLFYYGEQLKEWCSKNPDVNYNTLRGHILNVREKEPDISVEEIVDEYLKKEHFGIYRYYYLGIPLKQYCEEKNISYSAVLGRIQRYQKNNQVDSDDEVVNIIMNEYEPFSPKYMYKGMSLSSYCKINGISYYSVVSFVKRKLEKDKSLDVDDLIDEAIKTINRQGIIYYYKGVPLRDYCKENNLNASSIRATILRRKIKSNGPLQEIVNYAVEIYQEAIIKYYYGDEPLYSYCKKNKINYNTVISRYLDMDLDEADEERKETISKIVEDLKNNPRTRTKYFFQEESLRQYCIKMNYSYNAIYGRIRKYSEEFTYTLEQEVVDEAVLTYEEKNIIKRNHELFSELDVLEDIDILLDSICLKYGIDRDSLNDMINMGFDTKQAILLIWFLGDNKCMNDNILKNLYTSINSFNNKENLDIYMLFVLYKTWIVDTSGLIIDYFTSFLRDMIERYKSYYRGLSKEEYDNLWIDLNSYLLMLIDYIYLNDRDKLLRHLMYLLGERVRNYYEAIVLLDKGKALDKIFT